MLAASMHGAQGSSPCASQQAAALDAVDSAGRCRRTCACQSVVVLAALLRQPGCRRRQSRSSHVLFCAEFLRCAFDPQCTLLLYCAKCETCVCFKLACGG